MTSRPLLLSVNIDHVATLRQARGAPYPDPVDAARIAEATGAAGITAHLRSDRRHIQDDDVYRLSEAVDGKLNVEMATTDEMLSIAETVRPQQVTLVPERPDEVTTEGGLDVVGGGPALAHAIERLAKAGIAVSLFIDPDLAQVDALTTFDQGLLAGFEINTDAYTQTVLGGDAEAIARELDKVRAASTRGVEHGFEVYAGHGLTTDNVVPIAAIPEIEELNIGHWLVSRAALVGMAISVREMLDAMAEGRRRPSV
ncbi:MAG: pyridoxine 5'-phosphate synthase [Acidobacteriota bacterium]